MSILKSDPDLLTLELPSLSSALIDMLDKAYAIRPLDAHDLPHMGDPGWTAKLAYDLGFRACIDLLKRRAERQGLL